MPRPLKKRKGVVGVGLTGETYISLTAEDAVIEQLRPYCDRITPANTLYPCQRKILYVDPRYDADDVAAYARELIEQSPVPAPQPKGRVGVRSAFKESRFIVADVLDDYTLSLLKDARLQVRDTVYSGHYHIGVPAYLDWDETVAWLKSL